MGTYSSGEHATAICDRCGFMVPYTDIRPEWTGLRVCSECWEPKHPQLEPTRKDLTDPKPLRHPRPDPHPQDPVNPDELLETLKPSSAGQGDQSFPEYEPTPTPIGSSS